MNATRSTTPAVPSHSVSTDEIDASCRVPLLVIFSSAAFWLVVSSVFGMIASLRFHAPNLLSNFSCLTYGRVHPVATNALLYGFAIQAGLGVGLWIFAQSGKTKVAQPWLIGFAAKLWNLGVFVGLIGILLGDSTGFENLEMPRSAAIILFLSYLIIGVWMALTLHSRREKPLRPPQWFLLAALFWFPWIYSTAYLLLKVWPARGVMQEVVVWWFSNNFCFVWLSLVGLAAILYFVPKFVGRALHSDYLALFAFWVLILFGSWGGISTSAPLPAWMPALSNVAEVLTLPILLAIGLNIYRTKSAGDTSVSNPAAGFIYFGLGMFQLAGLLRVVSGIPAFNSVTNLTWFGVAWTQLMVYGFFTMTMVGGIYYIVPKITGIEWPSAKAVRLHLWLAAGGILLSAVPLAIGGIVQGIRLEASNPLVPFMDIATGTLPFLRASTMGELAILIGHILILGNVLVLLVRYLRAQIVPVYRNVTLRLEPAEVKP